MSTGSCLRVGPASSGENRGRGANDGVAAVMFMEDSSRDIMAVLSWEDVMVDLCGRER